MYDATIDVSLSDFKASLLQNDAKDNNFIHEFQTIIQAIFNLPEVKVGYSIFNEEDQLFVHPPKTLDVRSYILNGKSNNSCQLSLCEHSYDSLFLKNKPYNISNVEKNTKLYPDNSLYKNLNEQKVKSAIITPIASDGIVHGMLEIVSPNPLELNSINANKLDDIMPFLVDSVKRSKERNEDEMELLIQQECTSIHPSVHWKFKKEAKNMLMAKLDGEERSFKEIVFEDVYPLFGQIDIKGSSQARNIATRDDLLLQLKQVKSIIQKINKEEPLTIYEQLLFQIDNLAKELEENFQVDSERKILSFLKNEILSLYDHLSKHNPSFKTIIKEYQDLLDKDKGFIYKYRKDYDDSVTLINKTMSKILDEKQQSAQKMYPHYYERFKTDGVEHNLYIGESITRTDSFNKIYLYNLRLWQLQAMCEMENSFYSLKKEIPMPLDVASMILIFNSSLSLRFRMDEKRFDVDGTYNARYEVVKKRVDKAYIKGTDERITQPGKITIVYSQKSDGK